MPLSVDQVATVLALLMPGFVWMKIFYFFGLRTRKQDAQWYMWSVLLSAPYAAFTSVLHPPPLQLSMLVGGVAYGLIGGAVTTVIWRHAVPAVWPGIHVMATVGAWETVFGRSGNSYVQITTTDGKVVTGWAQYVGQLSDSSDPDLYLRDVAEVVDGEEQTVDGVEGLLLMRSQIASIYVFNSETESAESENSSTETGAG